eukprot:CCRYP_008451-RA/>CCRYP_008451-RA protein AED:0.21 eAED:1.00 QI:0/-1/0/1/-1/0/1/0/34
MPPRTQWASKSAKPSPSEPSPQPKPTQNGPASRP